MLSVPLLVIASIWIANAQQRPDPLELFGIPYEKWHCGSQEETFKNIAIEKIASTCALAAADFNHCCAVHVDCYSNQRGQQLCDGRFCDCLENVARNSEQGGKCEELSKSACGIAKQVGSEFYSLQSNASSSEEMELVDIPKVRDDFEDLLRKCPGQRVTFESCAINFNVCQNQTNPNCAVKFSQCIFNTKTQRDPSEECDVGVDVVLSRLISPAEADEAEPDIVVESGHIKNETIYQKVYRKLSRPSKSVFLFMTIFGFLFVAAILTIVIFSRLDHQVIIEDSPVVVVPDSSCRTSVSEVVSSKQ